MRVASVWGQLAKIVIVGVLAVDASMAAKAQTTAPPGTRTEPRTTARTQNTDDLDALREQVRQLHSQGKYTEAIPIAERYVALTRQKHGENHEEFVTAISWLAFVYSAQRRYVDAEPLYKRVVAIREKALGPDHPARGQQRSTTSPSSTAFRAATARPSRCISAASRSARRRSAPTTPTSGNRSTTSPCLYEVQGRYGEAEPLYEARAGDRREGAGTRSSGCRHRAQQPRLPVSGSAPLRRGRAAVQARARDPREGARPRPPSLSVTRSTTSPSSTKPRAATPRPSRCTSAPSRSARRRWARPPRRRQSLNNLA